MSPTQLVLIPVGLKLRFNRFANFGAVGSGFVSDRPRRFLLARKPFTRMRSATVLTDNCS